MLEFFGIFWKLCMKRATVSARPQAFARRRLGAGGLGLQQHTVRAVSPAMRLHGWYVDGLSEALKVSKFAVANAVGRTKDELTESDESASALKSLKFQDR